MTRIGALVVAMVLAAACSGDDAADSAAPERPPLRMNEIQVLGSHNSYHAGVPPELLALVTQFDARTGEGLDYAHPPISEQLEEQGARQLELDVYPDPDGGLYAERRGLSLIGQPTASGLPELDEPGFKVLHAADIDFESSCLTLIACLAQVDGWSTDNPTHLPILVLLEAKYTPTPDPAGLGFVDPPDYDATVFEALDAEIRTVFDDDRIVVPADVTDEGWPLLDDARGKVLFALDNDDLAPLYEGDLLFTAGNHFAKLNDPVGDAARIRDALEQGLLVRTRADADTLQARANDTTMRDAALASGAQFVSTDYLAPDARFSDYSVSLPGGGVGRCNPVTAPPTCEDDQLKE